MWYTLTIPPKLQCLLFSFHSNLQLVPFVSLDNFVSTAKSYTTYTYVSCMNVKSRVCKWGKMSDNYLSDFDLIHLIWSLMHAYTFPYWYNVLYARVKFDYIHMPCFLYSSVDKHLGWFHMFYAEQNCNKHWYAGTSVLSWLNLTWRSSHECLAMVKPHHRTALSLVF